MNVYELEKLATPAPWPVDLSEAVGEATGGTTCHESNCNERLSRHCRNNFLKALNALKELEARHIPYLDHEPLRKLISELEEVR